MEGFCKFCTPDSIGYCKRFDSGEGTYEAQLKKGFRNWYFLMEDGSVEIENCPKCGRKLN